MKTRVTVVMVLLLLAALADESDAGRSLNGRNLNGKSLNGRSLNGSELGDIVKWVNFSGASLGGDVLHDVHLEGSQIVATKGDRHRIAICHIPPGNPGKRRSITVSNAELAEHLEHGDTLGPCDALTSCDSDDAVNCLVRGIQLVGATFTAVSDTDMALTLRITSVTPPSGSSDIWHYTVEYLETDDQYYPICLDAATDINHAAVPIHGWWDLNQGSPGDGAKIVEAGKFTFACPAIGGLGKCVELGYRPWANANLDVHHQACARLIRGDYCGDSIPYTSDGALVNIYDNLGVQCDTEGDGWLIEAEWDIHGARCLNPNNRRTMVVPCFPNRQSALCGTGFDDQDTLLISETPDE
jgi:hypothetical protein